MTTALDPNDVASITGCGEAAARQATALLQAVLDAAQDAGREQTGAQARGVLRRAPRTRTRPERQGLANTAGDLAGASRARVTTLKELQAKIAPLDADLQQAELALRTAALAGADGDGDTLNAGNCREAIETRIDTLAAARGGLMRGRAMLERMLSTEHLVDDELLLMRDVAVPVAMRTAALAQLAEEATKVRAIADAVDMACTEMLGKDRARLAARRD